MKRGKKAQLTIFIILAILIVALILFIFLFWPKIRPSGISEIKNPYAYMETCIKEHIDETVENIASHGGGFEINPEMSFLYRGEYIRFLCHTNEYYKPCYKQYAFLKTHFENEILLNVENEINECFQSMVESYERDGFTARVENTENLGILIAPEFIISNLGKELYLTKGNENQQFTNFEIKTKSNLYEIIEVVENILTWESIVGNSEPAAYMRENPYIRVGKNQKVDGVKIYSVSHRETGEELRFATRSLALPPGFM